MFKCIYVSILGPLGLTPVAIEMMDNVYEIRIYDSSRKFKEAFLLIPKDKK